jgi:hypothetical protein
MRPISMLARSRKAAMCGAIVVSTVAATFAAASPGFAATGRSADTAVASTTKGFVPFDAFIAQVSGARYASYSAAGRTGAVAAAPAFEQMRSYILDTYRGVKVGHSYTFGGEYFDCVTVDSQPAVRAQSITSIATPPAVAAGPKVAAGREAASPLRQGLKDAYGNAVSCAAGTIPMQRISLERVTKFGSLQDFLAKKPGGGTDASITPGGPHRYGVARQYVTNYGGNSWINLWNPSGEFTLSQQWYATGADTTTQTVEGGWLHYPAKFGNNAVLFIYSTPDGYKTGCYNLECKKFVQTNNSWALGGGWSNYSTYGGTQWGFTMQWKYYNGNWWLYLQGAGALEAVGYYPGSVFNGGEMSRNATRTTYGGETYTGGTNWPQMGSGKFANAGFGQAAYQNTIFYIPQNTSGGTGTWSSLFTIETNPACYTTAYTPASSGGSWGTYLYFGGPGGNC